MNTSVWIHAGRHGIATPLNINDLRVCVNDFLDSYKRMGNTPFCRLAGFDTEHFDGMLYSMSISNRWVSLYILFGVLGNPNEVFGILSKILKNESIMKAGFGIDSDEKLIRAYSTLTNTLELNFFSRGWYKVTSMKKASMMILRTNKLNVPSGSKTSDHQFIRYSIKDGLISFFCADHFVNKTHFDEEIFSDFANISAFDILKISEVTKPNHFLKDFQIVTDSNIVKRTLHFTSMENENINIPTIIIETESEKIRKMITKPASQSTPTSSNNRIEEDDLDYALTISRIEFENLTITDENSNKAEETVLEGGKDEVDKDEIVTAFTTINDSKESRKVVLMTFDDED